MGGERGGDGESLRVVEGMVKGSRGIFEVDNGGEEGRR